MFLTAYISPEKFFYLPPRRQHFREKFVRLGQNCDILRMRFGVKGTCARAIKQRLLFSILRTLNVEFELYNSAFLRI